MLRAPAPGLVRLRRRHCRTHAEKGKLQGEMWASSLARPRSALPGQQLTAARPSSSLPTLPVFFPVVGFHRRAPNQELAKRQVPPCTVRFSDARGAWGALPAGDLMAARLRGVELFAYFSVLFLGFGVASVCKGYGRWSSARGHQCRVVSLLLSVASKVESAVLSATKGLVLIMFESSKRWSLWTIVETSYFVGRPGKSWVSRSKFFAVFILIVRVTEGLLPMSCYVQASFTWSHCEYRVFTTKPQNWRARVLCPRVTGLNRLPMVISIAS